MTEELTTRPCPECGFENIATRFLCSRCQARLRELTDRSAEPVTPGSAASEGEPAEPPAAPRGACWPDPSACGARPQDPAGGASPEAEEELPPVPDYLPPQVQEEIREHHRHQRRRSAAHLEKLRIQRLRTRWGAALASVPLGGLCSLIMLGGFGFFVFLPIDAALAALAGDRLYQRGGGRFHGIAYFGGAALASVILRLALGGLTTLVSNHAGAFVFAVIAGFELVALSLGAAAGAVMELQYADERA
jgi:hypothetical protein